MKYLLNLCYAGFLIVGAPWMVYRIVVQGKNRRGWSQKLMGLVPRRRSKAPCVWFHAVSVGEVNLLMPLVRRLRQQRDDLEIVISTTTETGFDLARQRFPHHPVFFFPFDFSWAIAQAIKRVRPDLIALAELELWPNFLTVADQAHVPVVIVNGRLTESSHRGYNRLKFLFRRVFSKLKLVMVQDDVYQSRFCSVGCDPQRVVVTGNVKFDGVRTDRENRETAALRALAGMTNGMTVWLAGSTQIEEDLAVAKAFQKVARKFSHLRLVLAPRHPDRCSQLKTKLEGMGLNVVLRSELAEDRRSVWKDWRNVLVIDVIGELGSWWGAADAAYVGGSMGRRGGQNMIEPAAYGIPVSFGPNTWNFRQVSEDLLQEQAAEVVSNELELTRFILDVISDQSMSQAMGSRAQQVVLRHDGAADQTIKPLLRILPPPTDSIEPQPPSRKAA